MNCMMTVTKSLVCPSRVPLLPAHALVRFGVTRRRSRVIRPFTQHQSEEWLSESLQKDAHKDLGPYLLWDKVLRLQAIWDSRTGRQVDLRAATAVLEEYAVEPIIVGSSKSHQDQELTTLTITCKHTCGDQVAAALLQLTPATRVSATPCEQCYLPQYTVAVHTPFGIIQVHVSLAGSRVCKLTPDWLQCKEAAAALTATDKVADAAAAQANKHQGSSSNETIDASAVAAAAVQQLRAGLEDGSIQLNLQYLI